jgi:hypothetical protein
MQEFVKSKIVVFGYIGSKDQLLAKDSKSEVIHTSQL